MLKYLDINTIIAAIWRCAVFIADWRASVRWIKGEPTVDAVFVTNMRDEVDRKKYLGNWHPESGHFAGPRYHVKDAVAGNIAGRTRAIDSVTGDLLTSHGRTKAKAQFVAAVEWAEKKGAKVILLAASTKRLFGEDGGTLKEKFPNLLFTIGDNGTTSLLIRETLRAFNKAGLDTGNARIGILGPYGHLGEIMTRTLARLGYKLVGAGANVLGLKGIAEKHGIETCQNFSQMGKVDAVVACTHSEKIRLTAENDELIREEGRKLLVIDVAEPSNLTKEELGRCRNVVIRQDAGNGYSPKLKYVLGAISYRMFRLTRGVTFGCFAETLSLAAAIKRGEDMGKHNWFDVSDDNIRKVEELFEKVGFTIPSPRCFGEPVCTFDLRINGAIERTERQSMADLSVSFEKF